MPDLLLVSPLDGWSAPLREVPDPAFANRLVGHGLAIDPTSSTLLAPCDGTIVAIAKTGHAITLRAPNGAEILMHIGIDTVLLGGDGFSAHVAADAWVKQGDPLISFDIGLLAHRVKSLITPIILLNTDQFEIQAYHTNCRIRAGERLLRIAPTAAATAPVRTDSQQQIEAEVTVALPHGIHARPAAQIVNGLRPLAASVTVATATAAPVPANSVTRLLGLGAQHGSKMLVRASGADARAAIAVLIEVLGNPTPDAEITAAATPTQPAPELGGDAQFGHRLRGATASAGIALGPAFLLGHQAIVVPQQVQSQTLEMARLTHAAAAVRQQLTVDIANAAATAGAIYGAHLALLDDPDIIETAMAGIRAGRNAGQAWQSAIDKQVAVLAALNNQRLQERVNDLKDIERRVLGAMYPAAADATPQRLPQGCIVIAENILPSQFATLNFDDIAGICTSGGGTTSHAAIIATTKAIPYLVGLPPALLEIAAQTPLLLDGDTATLAIEPDNATIEHTRRLLAECEAQQATYRDASRRECITADGTCVQVLANITSLEDARVAADNGADGCGLLRTEFLFLDRATAPTEAEQLAAYQAIADLLPQKPLTIRTLDIGGDKPIAYIPLPREENPALGLRGIRASLWQPEILRTQLRALLALRHSGDLKIMLPMVTSVAEIEATRQLLRQVHAHDGATTAPEIGAMVETPAAALTIDLMATQADFFSIGTNDLCQYTLAMDRMNAQLGAQNDALHPATLRLIRLIIENAQRCDRPVSICGGLASDPLAAPLLIGLGARALSVVPTLIPQLKGWCRQLQLRDCQNLADRAEKLHSAQAVRQLLQEFQTTHADQSRVG